MTPARELTAAIAGCLLGGTLVLGATSENWAEGQVVQGPGLPTEDLALTSYNVAPAVGGLAVLALAAVAALVATRGTLRRVVGALVLAAGSAIAMAALGAGARAGEVAAAMRTDRADIELTLQPWPWVAAVGALLMVSAGILVLVRGAGWPSMSGRYDAGRAAPVAVNAGDPTPEDLWRSLDRGDDPTAR